MKHLKIAAKSGKIDARPSRGAGEEPALTGLPKRIRAALATQRIEEVAEKIGVSASAIYNWLSGTNEPSLGKLFALAEITRTSPAWLIVGQPSLDAPDFARKPGSIPGGYTQPIYKNSAPPFAFEHRWLDANVRPREEDLARSESGSSLENWNGYYLLLEIPDDSMEPTLKKGDFVLVLGFQNRREIAPINGIYAVAFKERNAPRENWAIVPRRVVWSSSDDALLKCDNPTYPQVIEFSSRAPTQRKQDIEITGRVLWHGRLI